MRNRGCIKSWRQKLATRLIARCLDALVRGSVGVAGLESRDEVLGLYHGQLLAGWVGEVVHTMQWSGSNEKELPRVPGQVAQMRVEKRYFEESSAALILDGRGWCPCLRGSPTIRPKSPLRYIQPVETVRPTGGRLVRYVLCPRLPWLASEKCYLSC